MHWCRRTHALIVYLRDTQLYACQLGDSEFMVRRGGEILFKSSHTNQRGVKHTSQCGHPDISGGDSPLDSQLYNGPVQPGVVCAHRCGTGESIRVPRAGVRRGGQPVCRKRFLPPRRCRSRIKEVLHQRARWPQRAAARSRRGRGRSRFVRQVKGQEWQVLIRI